MEGQRKTLQAASATMEFSVSMKNDICYACFFDSACPMGRYKNCFNGVGNIIFACPKGRRSDLVNDTRPNPFFLFVSVQLQSSQYDFVSAPSV